MDLLPLSEGAPMKPAASVRPSAPPRPAPRPERAGVIPLAVVLWVFSFHLLCFLGFMALLLGADRPPAEGFPLRPLLVCLAVAAVPAVAYHAPRVRRRSVWVRLLVSGLALFTVALGLLFRLILAS
ncbi:hypothetical protein ACWD4X_27065 [Streptomyces termitum]